MKRQTNNKHNNIDQTKEKQTGPEELWEWISKITKWTCDALFNTLAASLELTRAWTSKLSEVLWNESPEIKSSRKAITKHHIEQTKKALNKTWKWIWNIINWWYHTAKWTIRTIFSSGKDTIKWLREDSSENKQENKQENEQKKQKD